MVKRICIQDIKNLIKKKKQRLLLFRQELLHLDVNILELIKKVLKIDKSQAIASIGQIELMDFYKKDV